MREFIQYLLADAARGFGFGALFVVVAWGLAWMFDIFVSGVVVIIRELRRSK